MAERVPKLPYTVQQVAEMYQMSVSWVLAEIASGRLRARHKKGMTKRWYMTDADLDAWEEGMLEEPAE